MSGWCIEGAQKVSSPLTRIMVVVFVYTDTFWPVHVSRQPIQYSAHTQLVVCFVILVINVFVLSLSCLLSL